MPGKKPRKPRKRPTQERSKMTVSAILSATAHILSEEGYEHANTNHIAKRAGVSIGSLYQYFPNKESLMSALIEQHSNEIADLVQSQLQHLLNHPLELAIPELVKAVIAAHAVNPKLHQVLNEEIPRSARLEPTQATEQRINRMLHKYLSRWADRIRPDNIEMTVFILSRTVETLCHSAVIENQQFVSDSKFIDEVSTLLIAYLLEKPHQLPADVL